MWKRIRIITPLVRFWYSWQIKWNKVSRCRCSWSSNFRNRVSFLSPPRTQSAKSYMYAFGNYDECRHISAEKILLLGSSNRVMQWELSSEWVRVRRKYYSCEVLMWLGSNRGLQWIILITVTTYSLQDIERPELFFASKETTKSIITIKSKNLNWCYCRQKWMRRGRMIC